MLEFNQNCAGRDYCVLGLADWIIITPFIIGYQGIDLMTVTAYVTG